MSNEKVGKNYNVGSELYQLENAIRLIFIPDYNVWQVHKLNRPTFQQLRYEIVGYQNSSDIFKFARLYLKYFKYGLDKEEMKLVKDMKYTFDKVDKAEAKANQGTT